MATPVVLTTGARPITPVESGGVPMTPVDTLGEPVTVVDTLGEPVVLINNDGTPAFLAYSAKTYLGGVAPYHWLDFINNRALYAGADVGNVTGATGYSFSRASQGYYTDSAGVLTLFGYNLLLYSQDFSDGNWNKTAAGTGSAPVVTANTAAAPDGTMTADTIVFALNGGLTSSDLSQLSQTVGALSGQGTWSIHLKTTDGSTKTITLVAPSGNLQNLTVTGSWQRFSISGSGGTLPRLRLRGDDAVSDSASLHVWGAQLEPSASLGSYVPTTTSAVGALRRGDRGVLIEGSRTNLCLQSQTLDDATWQKARCSIVANQYTAPDGTLTGDQLVEDTTSNSHPVFQTIASLANATAYTFSIYLLAVGRTSANIAFSNTAFSTGCNVTFTLSGAGTATPAGVISSTATITAVGGGWYRCTVTATSISAGSGDFYVQPFNGANSYLGNGLPAIGIWGAQLEAASFPSSYIPTTSASVTRAADVLSYTAGVTYPTSLWAEFERAVDTGGSENILRVNAGSSANEMGLYVSSADRGSGYAVAASVGQYDLQGGSVLAAGVTHKTAARTDTNSAIVCTNGTLTAQDSSVTLPTNPTQILVGGVGYIRRAAVFNSALTDAQLTASTT